MTLPVAVLALDGNQFTNPPEVANTSQISFTIDSTDQDVLAGQVYFIISSPTALEDQPIVFLLSLDGSIVKQISLRTLSVARRHWQLAFDTTEVPNGSYHLVVGRLNTNFQPEVWYDAGWKQIFNLTEAKVEATPTKVLAVPTTTPPTILEDLPFIISTSSTSTQQDQGVVTKTTGFEKIPESIIEVTKYCQDQGVADATQCSVLELTQRYPECRSAGLWQIADCQKYLGQIYFAQACEPEHITNVDQCRQYWQQAAGEYLSCSLPQAECSEISSRHVGELVAHWIVSQKSGAVLSELMDKLLTFETLQQGLSAHGVATDNTMIQPLGFADHSGLKLFPAKSAIMVEADGTLVSSWPAVMMFDSDADGLMDDAELRYGTKKDQADTDGDGYLDGDEVEHNFNPLGSGSLIASLSAVDSLIFSGKTWQQPLQDGDRDAHLLINEIKPFSNGKGVIISGQAQTLQTVTLFIYGSQIPLVASVRADEQGSWIYYLGQPLVDGRYTIYATELTQEGLIRGKSAARTMYLKNNQPVTPLIFVQEQPRVLGLDFGTIPSSPMILRIITGVIVAGSLLFFIGWLVSRKGR